MFILYISFITPFNLSLYGFMIEPDLLHPLFSLLGLDVVPSRLFRVGHTQEVYIRLALSWLVEDGVLILLLE